MTPHFHSTANPSRQSGPIQPMSREDWYFWTNRQRHADEVRARREGRTTP